MIVKQVSGIGRMALIDSKKRSGKANMKALTKIGDHFTTNMDKGVDRWVQAAIASCLDYPYKRMESKELRDGTKSATTVMAT